METGLPDRETFHLLLRCIQRLGGSIACYCMTLKLRQNCTWTNFLIAVHTVSNVTTTCIYVLHEVLFDVAMTLVPSRAKNQTSLPASFEKFRNCKMIIDCTDVEIEDPDGQSKRNILKRNFKLLMGVALSAVITYCSTLFTSSVSDKAIVQQSGVMEHVKLGDLLLTYLHSSALERVKSF